MYQEAVVLSLAFWKNEKLSLVRMIHFSGTMIRVVI